jgi:hypothetical protein
MPIKSQTLTAYKSFSEALITPCKERRTYTCRAARAVFNNQINLRWAEELQATMQNNPVVFTHMVRGF